MNNYGETTHLPHSAEEGHKVEQTSDFSQSLEAIANKWGSDEGEFLEEALPLVDTQEKASEAVGFYLKSYVKTWHGLELGLLYLTNRLSYLSTTQRLTLPPETWNRVIDEQQQLAQQELRSKLLNENPAEYAFRFVSTEEAAAEFLMKNIYTLKRHYNAETEAQVCQWLQKRLRSADTLLLSSAVRHNFDVWDNLLRKLINPVSSLRKPAQENPFKVPPLES
jgi:AraC-like DNA-binding protein